MNELLLTMDFEDQLIRHLPADTLTLSAEQVVSATRLSQTHPKPWQTYLAALARLGVEQWFEERMPELRLNHSPSNAAVQSQLTAGRFQLGLVTTTDITDGLVLLPKAMLNQPPDFYLLVEIFEELAQLRIYGFLPASQVPNPQQLELEDDQTYLVPLNLFDPDISKILLYIQYLAPIAAPQPVRIAQRPINASRWLVNQLDQVAAELSWVLLPPAPSWAMRSRMRFPLAQLDRVMTELINRNEIELPPQIGHAYQDLQLGEPTLRLYTVVWELSRPDEPPAWVLLLILGTPTGAPLPTGASLQVSDQTKPLGEPVFASNRHPHLYMQVSGEQHEQFYITVTSGDQRAELPPIGFSPED